MTNLHPIFQEAFNAVFPADKRIEEYRRLLRSHDWHFEYSDDHNVYCKGRDNLNRLLAMRRELDSAAAIWNSYAPASHQKETY